MPRAAGGSALDEETQHGAEAVAVLVVDDQEVFRATVRALVEATDGFVLAGEASSGEESLAVAAELRPRLVLMDKRMPGMGGVAAARELTRRHRDLVVVLVSLEEPDDALVRESGAAAFVRKQDLSRALLRDLWAECSPASARQGD